jgi:hypothetical protein
MLQYNLSAGNKKKKKKTNLVLILLGMYSLTDGDHVMTSFSRPEIKFTKITTK